MLSRAPIILFALDRDGVYTLSEGRGLDVLGMRPGDAVGRPIVEVFADAPGIAENVRRALAGETLTAEVETRGTWWEVHYAPSRDERGEVVGVVGVATDLTARKHAEETARRRLQLLDSVVENIPATISVKDARQLRFVRINRAAEEMLGRHRHEVVGLTDHDLFSREQADRFAAQDRAVLRERRPLDVPEEHVETPKKGVRVLRTKKIPILDEHGRAGHLLGISEDVTQEKQIAAERQAVIERLRQLDQLKARLVANVSHELRTPLTLIIALADRLLRAFEIADPNRNDIDAIVRNARALRKLVNDLLDIATLEAGAMRPDYAEVDLAVLTRLAASTFEVLAHERDISFVVESPEALRAQVDPQKYQRILANLLANALKFTPAGGRVRCSLESDGERAVLVVADSGRGIPRKLRTRIFERFFRIEGQPANAGGTGLGLAIVREFTHLHGGAVSVDKAPEGGARFVIKLPLSAPSGAHVRSSYDPGTEAGDEAATLRRPPREGGAAGEPEHDGRALVLVAEDNTELRRFLIRTLQQDYRVVGAADGEQALAQALAIRPDLMLTDIMMPRMTGDALVRAVRAHPELDAMPIMTLTAKADEDLRLRLLREGAQDYLLKPFSFEELRLRMRTLVEWKRARDLLRSELTKEKGDVAELVQQLAQRARELQTALDAAHVARAQAERASRLKSEFLALVAHEVRTPITSLRLRLRALSRRIPRATVAADAGLLQTINSIGASAERLFALVEALLERAAIESGRLPIETQSFDLADLVEDVLNELRPLATDKNLVLEHLPPGGAVMIESDPRLVRVLLANLVSNGIKFTAEGKVAVSVSIVDAGVRIVVRDTGPGIPADERGRIFEPFEQLAHVQHKHLPGLGLGLSIVRDVVRALGGRIDVESSVGVGSAFTVSLPMRLRARVSNAA